MIGVVGSGFVHFDAAPAVRSLGLDDHWCAIVDEFDRLPADPYKPAHVDRRRRYSFGYLTRSFGTINWPGPTDDGMSVYDQGGFNPEHEGNARSLPCISRETLQNPVLKFLIEIDLAQST